MSARNMMTHGDILTVLADPGKHADDLFAEARKIRRAVFHDRVFLYGFLYISTFCRNNCRFCFSRHDNDLAPRYRKTPDEVIAHARTLAEMGVHLIDVAAGEDDARSGADLTDLFRAIKRQTGLPIMASVGVLENPRAETMGPVDWYACYQETHNRQLFARVRPGQDFDRRYGSKVSARRNGLLVEEGIMTGIGETAQDIADSFEAMAALNADQVRVMSLVPQKGTPMQDTAPAPSLRELVITALLRLRFPDRLIPASLDVAGLAGLQQRLDAGANVITSIVPPGTGLAGVANTTLDIDNGSRTIGAILPVLERCQVTPGSRDEYLEWMKGRRSSC
jgi:methylornithine synthase